MDTDLQSRVFSCQESSAKFIEGKILDFIENNEVDWNSLLREEVMLPLGWETRIWFNPPTGDRILVTSAKTEFQCNLDTL
jgi:hypothetical protein